MANKYYAVRKGYTTGIYTKWDEARQQVNGYSGAEYKSFKTKDEAKAWLEGSNRTVVTPTITTTCKIIYTDGSYKGGKGGWAYAVVNVDGIIIGEKNGSFNSATNNRAELLAILNALKDHPKEDLMIFSDSLLCVNTLSKWAYGWEKRGWKKSTGETPKNLEIIKEILDLQRNRTVSYYHVYGHMGNYYNEYVDKLAKSAIAL